MRMVLVVMMVIGVIVILMVVVLGKARRNRPNSRVHLPSYQSGRRNSTMKDERTKAFLWNLTPIYIFKIYGVKPLKHLPYCSFAG